MNRFHFHLLVIFAMTAVTGLSADAEMLELMGRYSNVQSQDEGEHCSGFDLDLYKRGDSLVGLIAYSVGLCGDTPTGVLERVNVDFKKHTLVFQSKLSLAVDVADNKPTRDQLFFKGTFSNEFVTGKMIWKHQGRKTSVRVEDVHLLRRETMWVPRTLAFEEWKKSTADILKFRGPKW